MEKFFKLKENGTTVRTEIVAGLTTFMTMAYIIALNPNLLTGFGANGQDLWNAVFMATCLASAVGMFCMAFLANKPFAMAPGMGLNSFFAVVVGNIVGITGMSYAASPSRRPCVIILIEGIVFFILSVLNIREKIVEAIPLGVRLRHLPRHRPDADEHRPRLQRGHLRRRQRVRQPLLHHAGLLRRPDPLRHPGLPWAPRAIPTMVLTVVTAFIGLFVIILLAKKGVKACRAAGHAGCLRHLLGGRGHLPGRSIPSPVSGHRQLCASLR